MDPGPRVLVGTAVSRLPRKADEIQKRLIEFGARTTRIAKKLPIRESV